MSFCYGGLKIFNFNCFLSFAESMQISLPSVAISVEYNWFNDLEGIRRKEADDKGQQYNDRLCPSAMVDAEVQTR